MTKCKSNQRRRSTENRLLCWVAWWLYESHTTWPHKVIRVYGPKEYFTATGRHVWVEQIQFWRSLYRAVGMLFVWLKLAWDALEVTLWRTCPNCDSRMTKDGECKNGCKHRYDVNY